MSNAANVGATVYKNNYLNILLQMGYPKQRALKAFAATGNRSIQLASDWLLTHVNDPFIDDDAAREYVLYACPTGSLPYKLAKFWKQSRDIIGWNGVHNISPHITLVPFFKAPDEESLHLAKVMKHTVEASGPCPPGPQTLEPYVSHNFMGLFLSEAQAEYFKAIAVNYVKEVASESINLEPHIKPLHMTLAYQFEAAAFDKLKQLVEGMQPLECADWELCLYSRDTRFNKHRVHKVIKSHVPIQNDELELVIGDYVYIEDREFDNTDGWVYGTSWLTGLAGRLPAVFTERTLESDAWTLHRAISLTPKNSDRESERGKDGDMSSTTDDPRELGHDKSEDSYRDWHNFWLAIENNPSAAMADQIPGGANLQWGSENNCGDTAHSNGTKDCSDTSRRWYFALRHGERVDLTYGLWTRHCFDRDLKYKRRDLNMPLTLGERAGGPESYRTDGPLTRVGQFQAYLVGEGLRLAGVTLSHVYASGALRCVETAHHLLLGLKADPSVKVRVEPGLFEYTGWYTDPLTFMTPLELHKAGYNVDLSYKPYTENVSYQESFNDFYQRGELAIRSAVNDTAQQGGNIVFVGHASTLDVTAIALTRLGKNNPSPYNYKISKHLLRVPYCALGAVRDNPWEIVPPPCPPSINTSSGKFDWTLLHDVV